MLRIGSGAGFSGDRLEPALLLAEKGDLDYLVLECLAERTTALAQKRKKADSSLGYDPLLEKRIRMLLPVISRNSVRLVTNMGAANPVGGAQKIIAIASEMGISIKVAAVTGDDVLTILDTTEPAMETGRPLNENGPIISANAYLGADAILPALKTDADIIITGRVADPSLFLAPMMYHFGWSFEDTNLLAKGTIIGHLLECGGQLSGGYFADPGKKDVLDMANLGFPFADIEADGSAILTKLPNTGGVINLMTAKEQLLYEVINPNEYVTPDIIADFTTVKIREIGPNRLKVTGGKGEKRPDLLKVSVGYHAGFIGEGEISYAGANAVRRAELAGQIVKERLQKQIEDIRIDLIGVSSTHRASFNHQDQPYEVRLRIAAKTKTLHEANVIGEEVESLYTNGPAGGGGARKYVNEVLGILSSLIPRNEIDVNIVVKENRANEEKTI